MYTLIYAQRSHLQEGELTVGDVEEILQERVTDEHGNPLEYPADKGRFIVDAMVQFRICFKCTDDESRFVIPALLPANRPKGLEVRRDGAL